MKRRFLRKIRSLGAIALAGAVMVTGIPVIQGNTYEIQAAGVSAQTTGSDLGFAIDLTPSKNWTTMTLREDDQGYFYKISADAPTQLTLSVLSELKGTTNLRFYDAKGESDATVVFQQSDKKTHKYKICVEAGTYCLYISKGKSDDKGKLRVKYSQAKKNYKYDTQDNDSIKSAVDITGASQVNGMLTVGNMHDIYRYTYEKGKGKSIVFSGKIDNYMTVRVYEAQKLPEGEYDSEKYKTQFNVKKGEKYTYDFEGNGGIYYFDIFSEETGLYSIVPKQSVTSTKVTVIGKNITIPLGETKKIIKSVKPANAPEDSYMIASSHPEVAGVASNDSITGCKVGKAKVTVYYGRDYSAIGQSYKHKIVCNVTVTKAKAKKIKVTPSTVSLVTGKTKQLNASVLPAQADQRVTYKSSNPAVVKVTANGKLTAVKEGTAQITVKSASNPKVKKVVSVKVTPVLVNKITFKKTSYDVKNGTVVKLGTLASVAPSNAKNKTILWSSSNTNVVRVDASGNVTAVGAGTATITATSAGNPSVKAKVEFKVTCVIKSIAISNSTLNLNVGDSKKLSATLTPSNTEFKGVSWSSSDTKVAKVDANGNVTAVGAGKATITVTSSENANAKASCVVTVKGEEVVKPKEISITPASGTIQEGKKGTFTATLSPDGAKGTVKWSIADTSIAEIGSTNGNTVTVKGISCGTTYLTATIGTIKKTVVITVQ